MVNGGGTTTYTIYGPGPSIKLNTSYLYVNKSVNLLQYTVFSVLLSQTAVGNQPTITGRPNTSASFSSTDGFGLYVDSQLPSLRFYGTNSSFPTTNATTAGTNAQPLVLSSYTCSSAGVVFSWINGAAGASTLTGGSTRSSTGQGFSIGGEWNGSVYISQSGTGSVCNVYEVIVYNTVLTNTQVQQIEGYLAWKWGLVANLPSNHPYKNTSAVFVTQPTTLAALGINPYNSMFISRYFNPRSISGLQFWIDGADRTSITFASANRMNGWNDKSGNGYNLSQSTTAYQPIYFSNYVNLGTASNYYMNIPQAAINNASSWSMFFVFNPIESANYIMVKQFNGINTFNVFSMTKYSSSGGNPTLGTTNIFYFRPLNSGPLFTGPSALSLNTVQLISFRFDGTNLFYYVNGNLGATTAGSFGIANQTGATNFTLGGWFTGPETPYDPVLTNFNLGELQFFNNALSTIQRQQMEGYLTWKWGIQANLPATHPFKNFPPPP
jgi:hypothetical protein